MSLRSVIAVAVVAFLCCGSHPALASELNTGVVVMTTTGGSSSITLDVSIADNGAVPGCTWFIIWRDGVQIASFQRQLGVQNTLSITDTNVSPDHMYWYELKVSAFPVVIPTPTCDETEFRLAFGSSWGAPLDIPGHVGQDPIPVAHGKLVADENWPYARLELCGSPYWWYFEYGLPAGFEQYLGQDVLMYGEYTGWSVQNGWFLQPTSFEPLPCVPIATKNASWGHVKSLYR